MRFLGLQLEYRVPDAKTVWLFRERLKDLNLIDVLFARFHQQLATQGYVAMRLLIRLGNCSMRCSTSCILAVVEYE